MYKGAQILLNNYTSASIGIIGSESENTEDGPLGRYSFTDQHHNQFIYFRNKDAYADENLHGIREVREDGSITTDQESQCAPMISKNIDQLFINSDSIRSLKKIEPGESLVIPFWFNFYRWNGTENEKNYIYNKNDIEVQFDMRLSLFNDPINYSFKIKNSSSTADTTLNKKLIESQTNNLTKYNTVIAKMPKEVSRKKITSISTTSPSRNRTLR